MVTIKVIANVLFCISIVGLPFEAQSSPSSICPDRAPEVISKLIENNDWQAVLFEMKGLREDSCLSLPMAEVNFARGLIERALDASRQLKEPKIKMVELGLAVLRKQAVTCPKDNCPVDPVEVLLLKGEGYERLGRRDEALASFKLAEIDSLLVSDKNFNAYVFYLRALAETRKFSKLDFFLENMAHIDNGPRLGSVKVYVNSIREGGGKSALEKARQQYGVVPSVEASYCEALGFLKQLERGRECFQNLLNDKAIAESQDAEAIRHDLELLQSHQGN